jgi:hypothetical protein
MKKNRIIRYACLVLLCGTIACTDKPAEESSKEPRARQMPEFIKDPAAHIKRQLAEGNSQSITTTAVSIQFGVKVSPNAMECAAGTGICDIPAIGSGADNIIIQSNMPLVIDVNATSLGSNTVFKRLLERNRGGGIIQFGADYVFNETTRGRLGASEGIEISKLCPIKVTANPDAPDDSAQYTLTIYGAIAHNKANFDFINGTGAYATDLNITSLTDSSVNPGFSYYAPYNDSEGNLVVYMKIQNVYALGDHMRTVFPKKPGTDSVLAGQGYLNQCYLFTPDIARSLSVPVDSFIIPQGVPFEIWPESGGWFGINFSVTRFPADGSGCADDGGGGGDGGDGGDGGNGGDGGDAVKRD